MSKKDKRTIQELAYDYDAELWEVLRSLQNKHKPSVKYRWWYLNDIFEMQKFYSLIIQGRYKQAYNKLPFLWKECDLVPDDVAQKLFKVIDEYYRRKMDRI